LKAQQRAEERLKETIAEDTDRYLKTMTALKKSNLRLQAVKKYRSTHKTDL